VTPPRIRSTPLRLTLLLLTIFAVAAFGCMAVAYAVTKANIEATLEADLRQTIADYRGINDNDYLLERLSDGVARTEPSVRILYYLPDRGAPMSNVAGFPPVSGVTIIAASAIDEDHDELAESYIALSARVGAGQLIVAQSREQIVEMAEVFLAVLVIGLLPALLIAGLAGWWISRDAGRRIEAIQAALHALTGGTLSVRVAGVTGRGDDLSGIGQDVNAMAHAQEGLVSSMRQISSDIAHDLKTPIQRVAVVLDQMMNKTTLTDGQEVLLIRALDETDRIVRTFQALLQLSQIEGGAVRDRLQPVDLADVALDVVDFLEVDAEDNGFALALQTPDRNMIVRGDRQLLSQMISNLIQNVLIHVPGGGPIIVTLGQDEDRTVMTVSDNGPGIPASERENVLRRLYRLEQSRTTEGNGLGLSLVAAISDLHDATLTLEDNAPGLTVRVVFPGPLVP
jgi:signal transduction histidine kinase